MAPTRPRFPIDRQIVDSAGNIRQPWAYYFLTLSEQVGQPGDYAVVSDHRVTLTTAYSDIQFLSDGRTLTDGLLHFPTLTGDVTSSGLTVSLVPVGTPVSNAFVRVTTDTAGRVSATTPITTLDLTSLLDSTYVNASGDTMSGGLSTPYLTLQDFSGSTTEGQLTYSPSDRTASIDTGNGSSLQLGMESRLLGYNRTGSTIPNGTAVYILGAHADTVEIAVADNSAAETSAVVGVVTEDIPNNSAGLVTTFGAIHDLDTHSFSEGAVLWLGTAGGLVDSMPALPAKQIQVGFVVRSHPNQGIIFVRAESSGSGTTGLGPVLNTDSTQTDYWYVQYSGIIKRIQITVDPFVVQYCASSDWTNRYTLTYI